MRSEQLPLDRLAQLTFLQRAQERARMQRSIEDEQRRRAERACGLVTRPEPPDWLLKARRLPSVGSDCVVLVVRAGDGS